MPLSLNSLRAKKSVRVTFKLAPEAIDLLAVMASQLGIKQKTLFDQLLEQGEIVTLLAQGQQEPRAVPRRQKTFVLSQQSVETLNLLAAKHQAPRNLLVEHAIRGLLPILAAEQERHGKRKMLLAKIAGQLKQSRALLAEVEDVLGGDDPVCQEIYQASQAWQQAHSKIMAIIERGRGIEEL